MLFRCTHCPKAFCEDHLPLDANILKTCERYQKLGQRHPNQACFIICSDICSDFASTVAGGGGAQTGQKAAASIGAAANTSFGSRKLAPGQASASASGSAAAAAAAASPPPAKRAKTSPASRGSGRKAAATQQRKSPGGSSGKGKGKAAKKTSPPPIGRVTLPVGTRTSVLFDVPYVGTVVQVNQDKTFDVVFDEDGERVTITPGTNRYTQLAGGSRLSLPFSPPGP